MSYNQQQYQQQSYDNYYNQGQQSYDNSYNQAQQGSYNQPQYQQQSYNNYYNQGQQQDQYTQQQPIYAQSQQATSASQVQQPVKSDTKKKEGFMKQYFYWATPAMGIWLFLALCLIVMAWFTVGCTFCSVPQACATWSFDCATSQG